MAQERNDFTPFLGIFPFLTFIPALYLLREEGPDRTNIISLAGSFLNIFLGIILLGMLVRGNWAFMTWIMILAIFQIHSYIIKQIREKLVLLSSKSRENILSIYDEVETVDLSHDNDDEEDDDEDDGSSVYYEDELGEPEDYFIKEKNQSHIIIFDPASSPQPEAFFFDSIDLDSRSEQGKQLSELGFVIESDEAENIKQDLETVTAQHEVSPENKLPPDVRESEKPDENSEENSVEDEPAPMTFEDEIMLQQKLETDRMESEMERRNLKKKRRSYIFKDDDAQRRDKHKDQYSRKAKY